MTARPPIEVGAPPRIGSPRRGRAATNHLLPGSVHPGRRARHARARGGAGRHPGARPRARRAAGTRCERGRCRGATDRRARAGGRTRCRRAPLSGDARTGGRHRRSRTTGWWRERAGPGTKHPRRRRCAGALRHAVTARGSIPGARRDHTTGTALPGSFCERPRRGRRIPSRQAVLARRGALDACRVGAQGRDGGRRAGATGARVRLRRGRAPGSLLSHSLQPRVLRHGRGAPARAAGGGGEDHG